MLAILKAFPGDSAEQSSKFMDFAEWYVSPIELAKYKYCKEYAESVGVKPGTLVVWSKNIKRWPVSRKMIRRFLKKNIVKYVDYLYDSAKGVDESKGSEALLRLIGFMLLSEKKQQKKNSKKKSKK